MIFQGDSGGPLVCPDEGNKTLVGATSYGNVLCGRSQPFSIFTNITHYGDWINNNTGLKIFMN